MRAAAPLVAGDGAPAKTPTAHAGGLAADAIARHRMLSPHAHVIVAFSGGADSTALAVVMQNLGYRVTLGHVDHAMRPDSGLDVLHCRSTAARLGMQIAVARVTVRPPTEAEARRVRYESLERIRQDTGAEAIATGHTLNDEAETVAMRLRRGGFGLGIPPVRDKIVRPLLQVGRRQTEAVCREAGILYLEDPSNKDMRLTRNRVRRELMSAPGGQIERYAAIGAESRSIRTEAEAHLMDFLRYMQTGPQPALDRRCLLSAPEAVARGLLRLALGCAGIDPSERLVRDIIEKVAPHPGSSLDLPGGLAIWCERDLPAGTTPRGFHPCEEGGRLVVGIRPPAAHPVLPEIEIEVPGVTSAGEWGLAVALAFESWPKPGSQDGTPGRRRTRAVPFEELLDADALERPLVLRQWRPGDRFYPLCRSSAAAGSGKEAEGRTAEGRWAKKLQDLFVDAKVPKSERHRTPILTSGGQIAWVVGHRIDDRYKVTAATSRVARIRVSPQGTSRP